MRQCSDYEDMENQNDQWLEKKKEYLETIQKKSQSSLFVILCDKLHSVSCMINDHNKIGKKLWKNHVQTTNDILRYYKTLCNKLKKFLKNHKTLKDRFQRHVNELEYKSKVRNLFIFKKNDFFPSKTLSMRDRRYFSYAFFNFFCVLN